MHDGLRFLDRAQTFQIIVLARAICCGALLGWRRVLSGRALRDGR